jgi:predicted RNA-binding Zn ribbon-like protein
VNILANKFYLVGNNLALDFANSVMHTLTVEVLADWAVTVGLAGTNERKWLIKQWQDKELSTVDQFRRNLRKMVENAASGSLPGPEHLALLNAQLRIGGGYSVLLEEEGGLTKKTKIDLDEPSKLNVPVAEALADLFCYGDLRLLRKCENPNCILYFYDTTKNHRRRWCSMAVCGNQAKARKFYRKNREPIPG